MITAFDYWKVIYPARAIMKIEIPQVHPCIRDVIDRDSVPQAIPNLPVTGYILSQNNIGVNDQIKVNY